MSRPARYIHARLATSSQLSTTVHQQSPHLPRGAKQFCPGRSSSRRRARSSRPRDNCMSALRGTERGSYVYHRANVRRGQRGL